MKCLQSSASLLFFTILLGFFMTGCATNLTKPAATPNPTKVKLSDFTHIEMKEVGISEKFGAAEANQKALRKIDKVLFSEMEIVFPKVERINKGSEFSTSGKRTLQITPFIKEIKFISGGARFMVGAMAGSSAVLMQATFRDSADGKIIANPEFYRDAKAYSGGWSMGATDNKMLEDIAKDITTYCLKNK